MIPWILSSFAILFLVYFMGDFFFKLRIEKNEDFATRIYFKIIFGFASLLLMGFILAGVSMFKIQYLLISILGYFVFLFFLRLKFKSKFSPKKNSHKNSHKKHILILGGFIIIFLFMGFIYESSSSFPIGWDRGVHFSKVLYTINHQGFTPVTPGTSYSPFYFEGPNVLLSSLSYLSYYLSYFEDFNPQIFSNISNLSLIFTFFFLAILTLTFLSTYCLSRNLVDKKYAYLSLFFLIPLAFIALPSVGTIGTILGLNLICAYAILLKRYSSGLITKLEKVLLFIIPGLLILIHISSVVYFFIFLFFFFLFSFFKKKDKTFIYKILKNIFLSIFLFSLFSLIFNFSLFSGIIVHTFRKASLSEEGFISMSDTFYSSNIEELAKKLFFPPLFFVTSLIGIIYLFMHKKITMISFFFGGAILTLIPLLPFVRSVIYLIIPFSIVAGFFFANIFKKISKYRKFVLIVFLMALFFLSMVSSLNNLTELSKGRLYYDEQSYLNSFILVNSINSLQIEGNLIYPSSGALAHFIYALSKKGVLFSDPRYEDLPEMVASSKIYEQYPTSRRLFISELNCKEINNLLERYNITKIAFDESHPIKKECLFEEGFINLRSFEEITLIYKNN